MVATCVGAVLGLTGCKNPLSKADATFHIRFMNLIEDSPAVQYSVDTTAITNTGYQTVTALNPAHPGDHTVNFAALRPASLNTADPIDPIALPGSFDKTFAQDTDYTVFAYGKMNDVHTFVMDEASTKDAVPDDFIEYQFVNAAPALATADVYITAPQAQVTSAEKVATLNFTGKSAPTQLKLFQDPDVTNTTADLFVDLTFELRDPTTGSQIYVSNKVRVAEKTRLLFAIVPNTGSGPSPVRIVAVDGATGVFLDPNDQVAVRFVHASTDTPPLDIIRGSSLNTPLAQNIAYGAHSPYVTVPSGDVDLIGVPTGSTSVFLFVTEFPTVAGNAYSAYAVGPLASVDAHVLTDNRRSVPTQSQFRFLNAAASLKTADAVDIYVTLPGQALDFDSTDDKDTTDDAPQFERGTAVAFAAASDYTVLKSGTYEVRVASTGTSRMLLDTTVTVLDGSVETLVLNDSGAGDLVLVPVEEALE
jgi:hypothetical protein